MYLEAYFDGSCEPVNPGGTARWGLVVYEFLPDGQKYSIVQKRGLVGIGFGMTNNVAEASGLIAGLEYISEFYSDADSVTFFGDSRICIRHMTGESQRVPRGHYAPLIMRAKILRNELSRTVKCLRFKWIPRKENDVADALSKEEPMLQSGIERRARTR